MPDPIVTRSDAGEQPALPEQHPAVVVDTAPAGWFGKLPMLGDFASRRLPEAFIRPWDDWLQASLAAAKDATGERWLDLYLTFPVWRFVIPAGLAGDAGWVGVLLPSVDRVGRCFPLTICEQVDSRTLDAAGLVGIDAHLSLLADAGIDALEAGVVDFLEQRLTALPALRAAPDRPSIALEAWSPRSRQSTPLPAPACVWSLIDPLAATLSAAASRYVIATLGHRVLWWSPASEGDGDVGPRGALRLEPYPLSSNLLGVLIGTD